MPALAIPTDVPFRDLINPSPRLEQHLLPDNGPIPNNPRLPLLVYRGVLRLAADDPAAGF